MAMFKNKALYVQMVDPKKHQPTYSQLAQQESTEITEVPKWIDDTVKEYGLYILKGSLILIAANAAFNTLGQILVNQTSPRKR